MANSKDLAIARDIALSKIKKLNQPDDYRVGDIVKYIFSTGHAMRDGDHIITDVTDEWIFIRTMNGDRVSIFHRDGTGAPELRKGVGSTEYDKFVAMGANDGSDIGAYLQIVSKATPERLAAEKIRAAFNAFAQLAFDAREQYNLSVDVTGLQSTDLTIKREIVTYENF